MSMRIIMKKQNILLLMIGTTVLLIFLTLQVEKLYYFEYPSFLFCYENRIYGIPLFVKKSKTFLSDYIDKHQLPIPSARYDYFIFSKKTIGVIKYVYETGGVGNDIMKFCDVAKKKNIKHEKILYIINLISQGKFTEFQKEVWSLYYGKI